MLTVNQIVFETGSLAVADTPFSNGIKQFLETKEQQHILEMFANISTAR